MFADIIQRPPSGFSLVRGKPLADALLIPIGKERIMANKNTSVFGMYPDRLSVDEAAEALRAAGFRGTDISALFQENLGTKDFAHEKSTKAPEGATAGGIAGGIAGGVLGWLIGIGTLTIPGLGPLLAAGPVVAALAGVGAVGAMGAIIGALAGLAVPEYEAKRFEGRVKQGGVLMSVHCDNRDWVKRAKDLLRQTGAEGIDSTAESRADFFVSDKPLPRVHRAMAGFPDPLSGPDKPTLPGPDEAALGPR
jgi:hypothetical protein